MASWREVDRLAALDDHAILDTGREKAFDDIAELAADILEAPIAVVNFIASGRQWFKAELGIGANELPLDVSICRHAILQPGVFVVPDLTKDARFADNPLVNVADGLRFYAGALLETREGLPLGTVCILDTRPRPDGISERQERALRALAAHTMAHLELRRSEAVARQEKARAEKHSRRLSLVARCSASLLSAPDPERMIADLFELVAEPLELDACFLYECSEQELRLVGSAGLTKDQQRLASTIEVGQTVCGIVAETRAPVHLTAIGQSNDPSSAFLRELGIETYKSAPLLADNKLLGTLSFGRKAAPFSAGELEVLQTLTAQVATVLERFRTDAARLIALRQLGASEARLRSVLDGMGEGFALLDREARILGINAEGLRIDGRSPDQIVGRTHWEAFPGSEKLEIGKLIRRAIDEQVPVTLEHCYEWPDGRSTWFDMRAYPAGDELTAMFWRDITDRKTAEIRLRETSRRLDAILNNTRMAVFLMDDRQQCVFANPAAEELTGYSFAQMQGRPLHDVIHHKKPDGSHYLLEECPIDRAFPERAQMSGEELFVAPDGSFYPVGFTASPVLDDHGQPIGTVIEVRNIAEEKARNEELEGLNADLAQRIAKAVAERQATQAQLHEMQKLETIGQLTGGVAHDFNNLLTPIVGALDVASRRLEGDDRAQRLAQGGLQAAERARTLIQRLLAFARRQHLQAQPVDACKLVTGMADMVCRSLGPQVRFSFDCPPGLRPARIDPNQLELALLNLAVNARDAMPQGGDLTISVRGLEVRDDERLPSGDYIRIEVRDTGEGMDAATLARAVEPFFTTKGVGRGTGLGLSSVHGLAAQSGGRFELASELERGTTATLWLPTCDEQPVNADAGADFEGTIARSDLTVLLVDDEELVRASTADMLAEAGYQVHQAASGHQALQLARNGLRFDVLVTDYAMPNMTGAELAVQLRGERPDCPVLLITGFATLSNAEAAGLPRLAKPFRQTQLAATVAELMSEKV